MNNRVIKFRAWDKVEKEFIRQDYFNLIDFVGNTYQFSLGKLNQEIGFELMQFTGLKDKNGKEIYEGDIVKLEGWEPKNYEVVFDRGGFCLKWGEDSNFYNDIKYAEDDRGEIIGNIWESKHLLDNTDIKE